MSTATLNFFGLVFPELSLEQLIRNRLAEIQANEALLDAFFVNLPTHERDSFLNYLTQREVGVHIGWSMQYAYETPQVVISAAASQDEHFVGNMLGKQIVNIEGMTAEVEEDFLPIYQARFAAQTMKVTAVEGEWPTTGVIDVGGEIMSYEGDPADGTISIIRRGLRGSVIEAHAAGTAIAREEAMEIYGLDQVGSYWIDVCHTNSHFVLVLALMVQLALLRAAQTDDLSQRGLVSPHLTQTDLAPHRGLYPTTAFVRSLHFTCRYTISLDGHYELIHRPDAVGTVTIPANIIGGSDA